MDSDDESGEPCHCSVWPEIFEDFHFAVWPYRSSDDLPEF